MREIIYQTVCEMLCDAKDLEPSVLLPDTKLHSLKLDSLDYVELMVLVKREFNITIDSEMFIENPDMTLLEMCSHLASQSRAQ